MSWWLVCILPRAVARWLVWGKGQCVPLPASWVPYIFGRALGCYGKKL